MNRTKIIMALIGTSLAGAALLNQSAHAGGIGLYEIATPDVGLSSFGEERENYFVGRFPGVVRLHRPTAG